MTTPSNGTDDGGWAYNEVPREEFAEELAAILTDLAELIYDNPQTARGASGDLQNDWFFAGFGGAEDNFHVGLWPAYRPFLAGHEEGEVSDAEYAQMVWPNTGGQPINIYLGGPDQVIELAEDETSTQELAASFAELAGIVLVDDWDAGEDGDADEDPAELVMSC